MRFSVPDYDESINEKIKGVILDFDGTLFNSIGIVFHVFADSPFDSFHILKERLVRRRFAGVDFLNADCYFNAFFSELTRKFRFPKGMISQEKIEKQRKWYFENYMNCMIRVLKKHYNPRPGLEQLLSRMDSPLSPARAAIYSDYPLLKERMEALGLPPVKHIKLYGPESYGAQKPAARPFLEIADSLNLKPEEILVIGDREDTDGAGAVNSGMCFYFLETRGKKFSRNRLKRGLENNIKTELLNPKSGLNIYSGKWNDFLDKFMSRFNT
ncbi:MAG: HAD family hydrolase [Treponema sp.]|nr:HAD family hydrolase [Treponema sp.]